jgi:TolB-like protein
MKRSLIFMLMLTAGGLVFADAVRLDTAIREIAGSLRERIERDSVIVVSNIQSEYSGLSQYIIASITSELTRDGVFHVAERDENTRDMLARELQFQESGFVPEDTQKRIGREMGADYIISGEITLAGGVYRLTVRANHLESGRRVQAPVKEIEKSDITRFDSSWKEKNFYFGGRAGAVMNIFGVGDANSFYKNGKADPQISFNGAGQFAWQAADWASVQVEFIFFTSEMKWSYEKDWQTVTVSDIAAPLLFKPTFWVGERFLVSPFIGAYLKFAWGSYEWERVYDDGTISRSGDKKDIFFEAFGGVLAGLAVGMKAGPGIVFLDARYFFDGGRSRLGSGTDGELLYHQTVEKKSSIYRMHNVMLSIGYMIGF